VLEAFAPSLMFVHSNVLHPLNREMLRISYNCFSPGATRTIHTENNSFDFGVPGVQNRTVDRLVSPPSLKALQQSDPEAWNEAFDWLWPTAIAVAKLKLQPFLPEDTEDVAIEALEALVQKVYEVKTVEELKPLAASIAHHKAVSLLRERFAKKRGEGKTGPLDMQAGEEANPHEPASMNSPLADLEEKELAERLRKTLLELTPPQGAILSDFFLSGLKYEEIAQKRSVAIGSVGVYLKRGLETLRRLWGGQNES
jgi:RNA polymerase sigma factor (sigma-70 family)